jgi:hypothetical protein
MFSNYRSYYNKEPEQRCMTDHRIQIIPYLRLKINIEASQILVIWYSLHIFQYMGSLLKGGALLTVSYTIFGNKGRSPYNGRLSDFSFYIDSQISVHRKFEKYIN